MPTFHSGRMTYTIKRPTLKQLKDHAATNCEDCNPLTPNQDCYTDTNHRSGYRRDFSFYDHDESTQALAREADDCVNDVRPCHSHQCYFLMETNTTRSYT